MSALYFFFSKVDLTSEAVHEMLTSLGASGRPAIANWVLERPIRPGGGVDRSNGEPDKERLIVDLVSSRSWLDDPGISLFEGAHLRRCLQRTGGRYVCISTHGSDDFAQWLGERCIERLGGVFDDNGNKSALPIGAVVGFELHSNRLPDPESAAACLAAMGVTWNSAENEGVVEVDNGLVGVEYLDFRKAYKERLTEGARPVPHLGDPCWIEVDVGEGTSSARLAERILEHLSATWGGAVTKMNLRRPRGNRGAEFLPFA